MTAEGLDRLLDYRAPAGGARPGDLVEVPLGPRRVLGVVWGAGTGDFDAGKLRDVTRVLDAPPLAPAMREFLARAADYTLTPLPVMLRLATRAPGLGAPPAARPILRPTGREPERMTEARARVLAAFAEYGNLGFAPAGAGAARRGLAGGGQGAGGAGRAGARGRRRATRPIRALDPGAGAAAAVAGAGRGGGARCARRWPPGAIRTTLLKGVTGSGKTEVYLEAVAEALARGRQALVLLPEIALSVEFLDRVEARFGARPAEWHSGVTQAARRRAWMAVATGDARLVVGARSALFLPFADLGLIVVDEEHDGSYKQEDGALYHARDMAVLRASIEGAAVVLASATPSLESLGQRRGGQVRAARPAGALRRGRAAGDARDRPARGPARAGALDLRAAGGGGRRAAGGGRAGAALPQPARLCAADHLPRLRPPGRLRRSATRAWSSTASASGWSATSAARRSRSPTACPACKVEGRMTTLGPGVERLAEEAAALWPEARLAILSSDLAEGPRRAEGAHRGDRAAAGPTW